MCWWRDSACTPGSLWVSQADRAPIVESVFLALNFGFLLIFERPPFGNVEEDGLKTKSQIYSDVILKLFLFRVRTKLFPRVNSRADSFFFLLFAAFKTRSSELKDTRVCIQADFHLRFKRESP